MSISRSLSLAGTALLVLLARDAFGGCAPRWFASEGTSYPGIGTPAVADFNSDGIDDLATARSSDVSVLITNPGKPAFSAPITVLTGTSIYSISTADLNGDGHKDIVVGDTTVPHFTIIPGNGNGTFAAPVVVNTTDMATELATGDFNGDGNIDVAFRSHTANALIVWTGDGHGGFAERSRVGMPSPGFNLLVADWNKDGRLDVAMLQSDSPGLQIFRGNGDGTFQQAAGTALTFTPLWYATGDFDGDGDLDFAISQSNATGLAVLQNDGRGAFPTFDRYTTLPPPNAGRYQGYVAYVAAGDVTQDGIDDVVVAQSGDSFGTTFIGRRNTTLAEPYFATLYANGYKTTPARVILGRFNADAKKDLAFLTSTWVAAIAPNNCGEVTLDASAVTPLVSSGNAATISLRARTPYAVLIPELPAPTGTFSVYEETTLLATTKIAEMPYDLPGLTNGTHLLHATYSGDDRYEAAQSATFEVRVTNETTTTTLVSEKQAYVSGEWIRLTAAAKTAQGTALTGSFRFFLDGQPQPLSNTPSWTITDATAGEHHYQVQFIGDATHPASTSPLLNVRVDKAATVTELRDGPGTTRLGETSQSRFYFVVTPDGRPTGSLELYDGATKIATQTLATGTAAFYISLSLGKHTLTAKYPGDATYLPSSVQFEHTVVPNQPVALDATAASAAISLRWVAPTNARTVLQRLVNGAWTDIFTSTTLRTHNEPNPAANTAYIYRVQAYDASNALIGTSNVDIALLTTFSDDPAEAASTRVKAAHLTELVAATNVLRAAASLPPIALPNATSGKRITAANLLTLRNGIQDARVLLGAGSYPFTTPGTAGTAARAIDLQEMRNAVR